MFGAQKGGSNIVCSKVGYIKLMCGGRGVINVKTNYSPDVSETILSPGDITKLLENNFTLWEQYSNVETSKQYIQFSSRSGLQNATVDMRLINACTSETDQSCCTRTLASKTMSPGRNGDVSDI